MINHYLIEMKEKLNFDHLLTLDPIERKAQRKALAEKCQRPIIDKLQLKDGQYTIFSISNELWADDLTEQQLEILKNEPSVKSVVNMTNIIAKAAI